MRSWPIRNIVALALAGATMFACAPAANVSADIPMAGPLELTSGGFLEIESVGIRHEIDPGGLSSNGKISPPGGQVIWFTGYDRVRPGAVGTAVIAGHVINRGSPGVFHDLPEVRVGDTVTVGDETGKRETFRVVDTRVAGKDEVAWDLDIWGENTTTRRIALITCDDDLGFRDDGHRVANFVAIAEAI